MSDKKREEEAKAQSEAAEKEAKALANAAAAHGAIAGGTDADAAARAEAKAGKKTAVTVRHKTPHERYRCAGLALSKKAQVLEVTPEQMERLRRDPWVVMVADAEAMG